MNDPSPRLLVIDGDKDSRKLIRQMLTSQFDITETATGEMGIASFRTGRHDCVLVDQHLPDGDGFQLLPELVQENAAVILLTGENDDSWAVDAMRLGAQDYLRKNTLNKAMLRRVIRYAIERSRMSRELRQSIAALKDSEQRFTELATHIDYGLWIWSADGSENLYQNPASDRIYGRTLDEMNNIHWSDVIHPDDREEEERRAEISKETKKEYEATFRIVRPDGVVREVENCCYPLLGDNGEVARVIGICRDITDRVRLEKELRLAQKLESVGQLASGIAHEINTPTQYVSDNMAFLGESYEDLMPVLGAYDELLAAAKSSISQAEHERFCQLANNADLAYLTAEIPTALQQSRDGLNQIKDIVRAMKEFSHPSDEFIEADINLAIESTLTVARNEWKYVADVDLDLDGNLPAISCVPSAINQVLLNLIVNAAHAIADIGQGEEIGKGKISVTTSRHDDDVVIIITDTGCGIPDEIVGRIFDPFFTTKKVGKGTGQGLAIAHAVITERHGGSLSVETALGEGTSFVIRLPIDGPQKKTMEQVA